MRKHSLIELSLLIEYLSPPCKFINPWLILSLDVTRVTQVAATSNCLYRYHAVQGPGLIFCLLSSKPNLCRLGKQQWLVFHVFSFWPLRSLLGVASLLQMELAPDRNGVALDEFTGRSVLVLYSSNFALMSTLSSAASGTSICSLSEVSCRSSESFFLPVGDGSDFKSEYFSNTKRLSN